MHELDPRMFDSLRKACAAIDAEVNPPRPHNTRTGLWVSLAAAVMAGVAVGAWWLLR